MIRKWVFIPYLLILLASGTHAEDSRSQTKDFLQYKIQEGDTLSNIFRRLEFYPIWSKGGAIDKTIEINKHNPELLKNRHKLEVGQIISLPISKGDPRFQYDNTGRLLLGAYASKAYPPPVKEKLRRPASIKSQKIKNLRIEFGCDQSKENSLFKKVGNLVNQFDSKIENVNISFRCNLESSNKQAVKVIDNVEQPASRPESRRPAGLKRVTKYKIKPWMMSFAPKSNSLESGFSQKEKESSFYFPSIGYNNVSYKEGSFENSFTNLFVAFRYRKIISKPYWHIDGELKYGALSLSNDYLDSTAQVLDVDLRVGRAFQLFSEPWHFTLFAGAFYTQMLVSDSLYGYKGTYYPQIYPEIRRIFTSGNSLNMFLKYVPTGKNFLELGSEAALTLGAQYNLHLFEFDTFFNLSYSSLKFKSVSDLPVEINQTSFGVGAGF